MPFAGNIRQTLDPTHPINWQHPLNRGLVSWWLAHPTGGTGFGSRGWKDLCKKNDGVLTSYAGMPIWPITPSKLGALTFNGSNNYVNCGIAPSMNPGTGNFSVGFSMLHSGASTKGIFCKRTTSDPDNGWSIWTISGTTWKFTLDPGDGNKREASLSGIGFNDGVWHDWFISIDRAGLAWFYKDGVVLDTVDVSLASASVSNTLPVVLGGFSDFSLFIAAQLTNLAYWSRALPASEVSALYDQSRQGHIETRQWISTKRFFIPAITSISPFFWIRPDNTIGSFFQKNTS